MYLFIGRIDTCIPILSFGFAFCFDGSGGGSDTFTT